MVWWVDLSWWSGLAVVVCSNGLIWWCRADDGMMLYFDLLYLSGAELMVWYDGLIWRYAGRSFRRTEN